MKQQLIYTIVVICLFVCGFVNSTEEEYKKLVTKYEATKHCEYVEAYNYDYQQFFKLKDDDGNRKDIRFYIVGTTDANIFLSETSGSNWRANGYEIVLGAYSNSKILVRRRFPDSVQELEKIDFPNVLLTDQPTAVRISVSRAGTVEVYVEDQLAVKKDILPTANVEYIGFASNENHKNIYLFDCVTPIQQCPGYPYPRPLPHPDLIPNNIIQVLPEPPRTESTIVGPSNVNPSGQVILLPFDIQVQREVTVSKTVL